MRLAIVGSGYVGLVAAAGFSDFGNDVVCADVDASKIARLEKGEVPIYEPGLDDLIDRNKKAGRIRFTTDVAGSFKDADVVFIAVGTPPAADGSADMSAVYAVAELFGKTIDRYKVIVTKSTVPVGTADKIREIIKGVTKVPFAVASNPEFLKEGAAIDDFMKPDRVVVGTDDERAIYLMRALYSPFLRNRDRLLVMDRRSAELTKYAANAMLATRISFMNELANLAERLGADIELVRQGIGSDPRVGMQFLYPGCGYGGSCFPKDVKALIHTGKAAGIDLKVLNSVQSVNEAQKRILVDKVVARFGPDLGARRFALWGLSFKPGTDDMRQAPSLVIIKSLLDRGASVCAYDPVAMTEARREMKGWERVEFATDAPAAAQGADALIVVTEWKEFRSPDFGDLKRRLKQPVVFDGRNLYDPAVLAAEGFEGEGIGRRTPVPA